MKKRMRCVSVLLLTIVLGVSVLPLQALALGTEQSYSYNYDLEENALPAPDPYEVRYRIEVSDYVQGRLKAPSGMFVRGNMLYICDTGNSRILQLQMTETEPVFVRELTETDQWTLSGPEDIFVAENGDLYIADTGNRRILWLDGDLNIRKIIERPDDVLFESFSEFKPSKLVVNGGGRIYVQATGVNRGLMEFDPNCDFTGFMGASNVTFAWEDYIWKLLSTDAQKSQMESFVPTEYNNVALDRDGMIYTTTAVFSVSDLLSGAADPVRRLNQKGTDILIRNNSGVIGDLTWGEDGPSRFADVTVLDSDIYFVLDTTKKRIFAYDQQGTNLYVFGGYGTKAGYFINPVALEHWGNDLLVLDAGSGYITVLKPTEYNKQIMTAITAYDSGSYDTALEAWEAVLEKNGNYMMAYDGIGKILLRRGDYREALDYLEYADDDYYYSKAWKLYRKDWIETYLIWIIVALIIFVVFNWVRKVYNRERGALENYEERKRTIMERQGK